MMTADELEILYRDDSLLVVNKPSGLVVHRGWGRDPLVVVDLVRELVGGKVHPIHRLDRGTSGVLVFALNSELAGAFGKMLTDRQVNKRYIALVSETPRPYMMIDRPISRRKDGPPVPSCTLVRRLYAMEYYSLVEAVPLTGRLHQIRRHLVRAGHAVIGDKKHGYRWKNQFNRTKYDLERMALHAWSLSTTHPFTGEELSFQAPIPAGLMDPFDKMGIPKRVWDDLYAAPRDPWIDRFPPFVAEEIPHQDPRNNESSESA
jgi:tRNA pseudouridine65 synthase